MLSNLIDQLYRLLRIEESSQKDVLDELEKNKKETDDNRKTPVIAPHVVSSDISSSQGDISQVAGEFSSGVTQTVATQIKFYHQNPEKDKDKGTKVHFTKQTRKTGRINRSNSSRRKGA